MASPADVAKAVTVISAAYPSFNASKETVEVYYKMLEDLPAEEINLAVLKCCAEDGRKFAPSVGELRGAVKEIRAQAAGVPSPFEAWEEVCHAPRSGETKSVTDEQDENGAWIIEVKKYQWSHSIVERTARLLGFPDFPDLENIGVERAHFLRAYDEQVGKMSDEELELPMIARYVEKKRLDKPKPIKELVSGLKGQP